MSIEKIKILIPNKIKFYIKNTKRLFDVFLMMIALNFKPSKYLDFPQENLFLKKSLDLTKKI